MRDVVSAERCHEDHQETNNKRKPLVNTNLEEPLFTCNTKGELSWGKVGRAGGGGWQGVGGELLLRE